MSNTEYEEILGELRDLYDRRDEIRDQIDALRDELEESMRRDNIRKLESELSGVRVSLKKSRSRRRFQYSKLQKENEALYHSLKEHGFITESEPSSPYTMYVRRFD